MPNTTNIDKKSIRELAKIIEETKLTEIEYEAEGVRIRVARNPSTFTNQPETFMLNPQIISAAPKAPEKAPEDNTSTPNSKTPNYANHQGLVKSPMVGVVYVAPEPGKPAFVKEGDSVTKDQTLLLVEAMKTFNPVKAHTSGKIIKILIEDGMPVEYGEPLMVIG